MAIIKPKRGLKANLNSSNAAEGEFLITTDTNEVYVGKGTGNNPERLGADKTVVDSKILDLENQVYKVTPIDIAKTNFVLSSAIANQTKYELSQMIVEQFNDSTFIDSSLSESKKYKLVNGVLLCQYDFTGGSGGTGTTAYTVSYGGNTLTFTSIRTTFGSTAVYGMFDETLTTVTTNTNSYTTARNTSNYGEDVMSMTLTGGIPINKVVIYPYVNASYNFTGLLMANSGAGLSQVGNFDKGSASTSNTVITLNSNSVTDLRLRGTGVSASAGSAGYGVNELTIIPPSAYVTSKSVSTTTTPKRVVLSVEEDLTSSGSSISYQISFNDFSTSSTITPGTTFTSIPSGVTSFRIRATLNNGAGLKAYAVGWS